MAFLFSLLVLSGFLWSICEIVAQMAPIFRKRDKEFHEAVKLIGFPLELLIHLGLDTVKLQGKGFCCMVEVGDEVKRAIS